VNKEEYEIMYRLEDTHWWYVGMRRIVHRVLRGHLSRQRELRILDAGCGTGGMMENLGIYGAVVGIDASPEAVGFCCDRGLRQLAQASVTDLPFDDASFDLVVSFDVLYHRAVLDDGRALEEFHRVLKPNGHVLLRLPAFDWLRGRHDEAVHTRQRYRAREIDRKLAQAGFRVEKVTYANTILFPLAVAKRACEMAFRISGGSDVKPTSPMMNRLLTGVLGVEAEVIGRARLPWGLSVLALAERG